MADRFWVGGTASWDGTAGTKWSTTSGGAGGASVPTSADDVYFDAASGTVTVTVTGAIPSIKSLNCTGFTGTLAGNVSINVVGNVTLSSTMTYSHTGFLSWSIASGTATLTTNGVPLSVASIQIGSSSYSVTLNLGDALTSTSGGIAVINGTFNTNNYNVTTSDLTSSGGIALRTINLGSSIVTLVSTGTAVDFSSTNNFLTFNAGTSSIVLNQASPTIKGGAVNGGAGVTFYDVAWTSTAISNIAIQGANTFNNLSVAGRTSLGVAALRIDADQTINGTLTLSAGTNATMRTFVRSDTLGTTRTLTCAAVASLTDIDFRDITIAGAAAPVSGTRLGDCKGNSGITFDAPKTVYFIWTTSTLWGSDGRWSNTSGGPSTLNVFPLAQDTAVFDNAALPSGSTVTINAAYNIGTIDMSARTSNTMTLACSQGPTIYGNWINGTGVTLSGTGTLTFAGRGSQTITSAGKTFTQAFRFESPGGSVTLQDAFETNRSNLFAFFIASGTFDANGYNVTVSGSASRLTIGVPANTKTVSFGSGTWTIAGSATSFLCDATGVTASGTGTISLTSASAKTFAGGDLQTYPTLNQGGTGALTVTGSNKFQGLTNTAIGSVLFTGGTTNEFTSFVLNGASGTPLTLGSTSTIPVTLKKTGAWNVGANSVDGGNNTGLSFTAGDMDYLSISYVTGEVLAFQSTVFFGSTNITAIYYGSTPVNAIYCGTTQVF